MADTYYTVSSDQKLPLVDLIRRLPSILSGRSPDVGGIAAGFRSRLGFKVLDLVAPNFNELGRGGVGADGDKWKPLSKAYLAYGRRFGPTEQADLRKKAGLSGKTNRFAPGDKKGLLDKNQLRLWRRTYADRLAFFIMREPDNAAKAHAAAIAWIVVKKAGGKTKLDVYGNRQVQILVDTGRGAGSLQPGTLIDSGGVGASREKPSGKGAEDQVFETTVYNVIVGTNVKYMSYHHAGRRVPKRRLWPEHFPTDWWNGIIGSAISGLTRIGQLFGGGRGL